MHHLDLRHFAIQDWQEAGDIIMEHIPGVLNPSNNMTKPLGMPDIVTASWDIILD